MSFRANDRFKIWNGSEFVDFLGISKKVGNCIKIVFEDGDITVTRNHRFGDVSASIISEGSVIDGKKVVRVEDAGELDVFDPVEVDGHLYESNGVISHNCSFIGSSKTLVSGEFIETLSEKEPIDIRENLALTIYEEPIVGVKYLCGVDVAVGTTNDYSVVQVVRILGDGNYRQVAVYAENTINPISFAREVKMISNMYNHAQTIIESNGPGATTINELWYTLEFEELVNTDKNELGTRSTTKTKLDACLNFKELCENHKLEIVDSATIKEITQFVEVSPNRFAADKNCHDDRVAALMWCLYGTTRMEVDLTTSDNGESSEEVIAKDEDDKRLDAFFDAIAEEDEDDSIWTTIKC